MGASALQLMLSAAMYRSARSMSRHDAGDCWALMSLVKIIEHGAYITQTLCRGDPRALEESAKTNIAARANVPRHISRAALQTFTLPIGGDTVHSRLRPVFDVINAIPVRCPGSPACSPDLAYNAPNQNPGKKPPFPNMNMS